MACMQCSGGRVLMEHDSSLVGEVLAKGGVGT
jgi:hypothetical protein